MKFVIDGVESPTGDKKRIIVEAQTEAEATDIANHHGIKTLKIFKLPPVPWGNSFDVNASIPIITDSRTQDPEISKLPPKNWVHSPNAYASIPTNADSKTQDPRPEPRKPAPRTDELLQAILLEVKSTNRLLHPVSVAGWIIAALLILQLFGLAVLGKN